jgi:hypothetical protein
MMRAVTVRPRWSRSPAQVGRAFTLERLQTTFHAVSTNPGVLLNSQNVPLYLFCFGSANPKGAPTALKIAGHLLKRLDS